MVTAMTELKPCPFCGGDGSMSLNIKDHLVFGSCWMCGATGSKVQYKDKLTSLDLDKAINLWNRLDREEDMK